MLLNSFYKMDFITGENSYQERISIKNKGEAIFESYCTDNSIYFTRVGFDEVNRNVPDFFKMNPFIRNLPDYYIHNPLRQSSALIMVKGTRSFKQNEFYMIDDLNIYYASEACPLYYAFCLPKYEKPVLFSPQKVKELYLEAEDKQWDSDSKIYRTLDI